MFTRLFWIIITLFNISALYAQVEICDNGIDDDMDGLIDCFDDDCCMVGSCSDFYYNACLDNECLILEPGNLVIQSEVIATDQIFESFINFVVGDLTRDGNNEIVMLGADSILYVLDANTQAVQFSIDPGKGIIESRLLIADVVSTSPGAEIIYYNGANIQTFSATGAPLWSSEDVILINNLSAADFDQNGVPEIYTSNRIFDGNTGAEILFIPNAISNSNVKGTSVAIDILPDSFCPDCSGLELVSNSKVYAIDMATGTFTLQRDNSAAMSGSSLSVCADWDNDGVLDVLSMSDTRIAVWNPFTDVELQSIMILEGLKGLPNINDIDGDGLPEMVYISEEDNGLIIALDNDLTTLWTTTIRERTGYTAVTMFDFDSNNTLEIVYRDEMRLGILNGLDGTVVELISCTAITQGENPIVVDYNMDDEAEILVVCGLTFFDSEGRLTAFSSGGTTTWADSRSIWNQENYFNVHINDDLTVPAVQQAPQRPNVGSSLNGFLNQYQIPETIETNLSLTSLVATDCENIQLEICNTGVANVDEAFSYTLYYGNPTTTDVTRETDAINIELERDSCFTFDISIDADYVGELFVIINDAGTTSLPLSVEDDFPNTSLVECDYADNLLSVAIAECGSEEICNNGIDDDGDGFTDCEDPDCTDLALTSLNYLSCDLIMMEICNLGGSDVDNTLPIVVYSSEDGEPISVFDNFTEEIDLSSGECVSVNFTISATASGEFLFNINDNGTGVLPFDFDNNASIRSISECSYSNDYTTISIEDIDISFDLGNDLVVCSGEPIEITGPSGSFSYEWSSGEDTQLINPTTSGTYSLIVTDECNNSATDVVTVTIGSEDFIDIGIDICSGDSVLIGGTWITPTTPSLEREFTNSFGCDSTVMYAFTYREPSLGTLTIVKCLGENYTFPATGDVFMTAGIYEIRLSNVAGCDSLLTLTLEDAALDIPVRTIEEACPGEANGKITLDFEASDSADYTYEWVDGISTTNEADLLTEGNYFVTITNPDGCSQVLEAEVSTIDAPTLLEDFTDIICVEGTGTIDLNSELDVDSFTINMEEVADRAVRDLNEGSYRIIYKDDIGCEFVETVTIATSPDILASLPDTTIVRPSQNFIATPTVSGDADYTYLWSENDNISCTDCQSTQINTEVDFTLELLVNDEAGCTELISTYVKVEAIRERLLYIPNVFYPNSTNIDNATFKVFSNDVIVGLSIEIYDRWGGQIYASNEIGEINGWDGRSNGDILMPGVYVYIINVAFDDGTSVQESGDITILR